MPPRRRPLPLLLLAALALSACASYFRLDVRAEDPERIGSVFVLFGKEEQFAPLAQDTSNAQLTKLLQPAVLERADLYPCYIECEVDEGGAWRRLSERESRDIKRVESPKEPEVLRFRFNRKYLEQVPDLALCVISRSKQNEFRVRHWTPEQLAHTDGTVEVDVRAGEAPRVRL